MARPLIGITVDVDQERYVSHAAYARAVEAAGGIPILIPPIAQLAERYAQTCDGLLLTGGDDPRTEGYGVPTHPLAKPMDAQRQRAEEALLDVVADRRALPVLGICLGMQMMALRAGGMLDQHLPDTLATAARHAGNQLHAVTGSLGDGAVTSSHRQAVSDPGPLAVLARADDGVIEAIGDPSRPFFVGVQWHPERTSDPRLGAGLFRRLIAEAARAAGASADEDIG